MKINNSLISYFPKNSIVNKQYSQNSLPVHNSILKQVPTQTIKAYSFGVSVKKRDDLYSDKSKFAEYFFDKLEKKMQVKTEEDIQKVIDNTIKETNADEKTVLEVMSRVVQFGDYSNLEDLDNSIRRSGYNSCENAFIGVLSLSNVFDYLYKKQQFMNNDNGSFSKLSKVNIIDNNLLDYAENIQSEPAKNYIIEQLKKPSLIVDGWNTKIDGKNMSYSMFGSEYDLQTITTSIIKEMQKTGKTLDSVLNGETIERCKKLIGEDFEPVIIKSEKEQATSAKEIAERLRPKMPTKEQIEKFVDVVSEATYLDKEKAKKLICKYLDVTFEPYSVERMNSDFKNMHKMIENKVKSLGKTMEDVVYIYPSRKKSFTLMLYQYAKVNNIPVDKIKQENGENDNIRKNSKIIEKDKVYVLLDDVSASGLSLLDDEFCYSDFLNNIKNDKNTNIIFAPLYSSQMAKSRINCAISDNDRDNIDFFLSPHVRDYHTNVEDNFPLRESFDVDRIIGGKGFSNVSTSVMFPFCITDTDTKLSALFSTFFVRYPNEHEISTKVTQAWEYRDPYTYFKITRDIGSYNEHNPWLS